MSHLMRGRLDEGEGGGSWNDLELIRFRYVSLDEGDFQ